MRCVIWALAATVSISGVLLAADPIFEIGAGREFVFDSGPRVEEWGDGWSVSGSFLPKYMRSVQPVFSASYTWLDKDGDRFFDARWSERVTIPPLGPGTFTDHKPRSGGLLQAEIAMRFYLPPATNTFYLTLPFAGVTYARLDESVIITERDEDLNVVDRREHTRDFSETSWHAGFGVGLQIGLDERLSLIIDQRFLWTNLDKGNLSRAHSRLLLQVR
jgi:hypothetical protein